ncbi:MAG: hypothetical protein Nk1A_9040 [Endomicrobiia bacterium]|nr:MAG: hypothetical protein Nk1A_9040 [Endomicrobiia bacterium]
MFDIIYTAKNPNWKPGDDPSSKGGDGMLMFKKPSSLGVSNYNDLYDKLVYYESYSDPSVKHG